MQIFDARHEEKGHLENLGTNSNTIKTDLSQTNRVRRCGLGWSGSQRIFQMRFSLFCTRHRPALLGLFTADKNLRLHSPDITLNITRSSFALYFVKY